MRPSVSQQDFILYAILCSVSSRGKLLDYPLIPYWPDAFYVPELIRFLAGVEDFACRSAHFQLRAKFPSVVHSNAKRSCLICLCDRKISVEDTEWHLLFGCQVNVEFRSKYFASLLKAPPPAANLPSSPSISSLVSHFLFARESSENIYSFAQFVSNSLRARQRRLRRLQAQSPSNIFSEAESFATEPSNFDLPDQPDVHSPGDPQEPLSSCPACRGLHLAHTCGKQRAPKKTSPVQQKQKKGQKPNQQKQKKEQKKK